MFYEEDEFDSDNYQSRVAVLASYDGRGEKWRNPYGILGGVEGNNSGSVVFTTDMKMMGMSVDPNDYLVYVAGYRATDPTSSHKGGMIVLKKVNPGLIYGSDSAIIGPLHFVDGMLSDEKESNYSWDVSAPSGVQPLLPDSDSPLNRTNLLGDGGNPLPASESFPDVLVDEASNVYVFYTLLTSTGREASEALGKVYCKESGNLGYWFSNQFVVADLGYSLARGLFAGNIEENDSTFEAKHITCLYDSKSFSYILFFWAGGKIFMKVMPHPSVFLNKNKAAQKTGQQALYDSGSLYLVDGNTDFTNDINASGINHWLQYQWNSGDNSHAGEVFEDFFGDFASGYSDNWSIKNGRAAKIRIVKYADTTDIPAQRVGAVMNDAGEVVLLYLDSIGNLLYKRIRLHGGYPLISPALAISPRIL